MKIGCVMGKYLPPHRGHLASILLAHSMCDKLFIIVSKNEELEKELCKGMKEPIPAELRKMWLKKELQGIDNIEVEIVDEVGLECFPNGDWSQWANEVRRICGGRIDFIYGGEPSYLPWCNTWIPEAEYVLIDPRRTKYPISGTEIRENPIKHWDYVIGSARSYFAKKVLISGTESCGKTTLTKKLAKMYYTSWSEEIGRSYSERYLGGDERAFTSKDFGRIAYLQYENDLSAMIAANKVCFFDTDAVVTLYYSSLYLGKEAESVRGFIDPNKYDLILFLTPEVKWVDDGLRFLGEQKQREELHIILRQMYKNYGFRNIAEVGGENYEQRLSKCIELVDLLLK